jgi:hypothetical protein
MKNGKLLHHCTRSEEIRIADRGCPLKDFFDFFLEK